MPLSLTSHGAFDPNRCTTINGKRPGAIQTTALLQGNPYEYHPDGKYHFGFRATLIRPWVVKLLTPVKTNLTGSKLLVEGWKEDWKKFIAQNRGAASRL
jgi:hypothetical protein